MAFLFSVAASFLGLFAVSGAVLLTSLVLRNPRAPRALQNEGVAQGAAFVLTAFVCVAVGYAANTFSAMKFSYVTILIAIGAILVVSSYLLWKVFGIGERLKRAEQAQSPFARDQWQPLPQAPPALKRGV